jgi:hypothetical protein
MAAACFDSDIDAIQGESGMLEAEMSSIEEQLAAKTAEHARGEVAGSSCGALLLAHKGPEIQKLRSINLQLHQGVLENCLLESGAGITAFVAVMDRRDALLAKLAPIKAQVAQAVENMYGCHPNSFYA